MEQSINGAVEYHHCINIPDNITGIRWLEQQRGMLLLTGLNRKEVEETGSMLDKHNITYHILPTPVEFFDRLS